jgi:hypothetical protein
MSFVHGDPEFGALLTQVSAETGISIALLEKDYWITHSLWALHETKLAIWFEGGTSLFELGEHQQGPDRPAPRVLRGAAGRVRDPRRDVRTRRAAAGQERARC